MRFLILSGALLSVSCATTNEVLSQEPEEVFHSIRSVDEVAACFESRNGTRVIERADGARVARFRNGYGGVTNTFSIVPEGSGSRIEVRSNFIGMPGIRWKQCVGLGQK